MSKQLRMQPVINLGGTREHLVHIEAIHAKIQFLELQRHIGCKDRYQGTRRGSKMGTMKIGIEVYI